MRCIGRGERLYVPMPFFWTGGLGAGLLSALVAGATLLTESDPTPGSNAGLPVPGARLAVPRLAGPGRPHRSGPRLRGDRPLVPRPGQPPGAASGIAATATGRARQHLRHDGDLRSLLREQARHGPAGGQAGQLRTAFRRVSRSGSSTLESGAPVEPGHPGRDRLARPEPHERNPRAPPRAHVHTRWLLPNGRSRRSRRGRLPLLQGARGRHVQGERGDGLSVRSRSGAPHDPVRRAGLRGQRARRERRPGDRRRGRALPRRDRRSQRSIASPAND